MMIQMTGHSFRDNRKENKKKITFLYKLGLLIGALVILSSCLKKNQPLKIAIIDTGFCPSKIELPKNIKVQPKAKMPIGVEDYCAQFDLTNRRFHGHQVLSTIIDRLKIQKDIEIYPIVVFDNQGKQSPHYWEKALKFVVKNKIDFVVSAAGAEVKDRKHRLLPKEPFFFMASGQRSIGIEMTTRLFPQGYKSEKSLLIGSYHPPILEGDDQNLYNKTLLYQSKIDYYFPHDQKIQGLQGSSLAVSLAFPKALNLCEKELNDLKSCLSKLRKSLKFSNHKEVGFTF